MTFTELFTQLVIRHKVMTMTEFYNADAFDVDVVSSNLSEVERDASERMRNIMWAILQPNSKKALSPDEIVKFGWEKKDDKSGDITTKEQFEQILKRFNLKSL